MVPPTVVAVKCAARPTAGSRTPSRCSRGRADEALPVGDVVVDLAGGDQRLERGQRDRPGRCRCSRRATSPTRRWRARATRPRCRSWSRPPRCSRRRRAAAPLVSADVDRGRAAEPAQPTAARAAAGTAVAAVPAGRARRRPCRRVAVPPGRSPPGPRRARANRRPAPPGKPPRPPTRRARRPKPPADAGPADGIAPVCAVDAVCSDVRRRAGEQGHARSPARRPGRGRRRVRPGRARRRRDGPAEHDDPAQLGVPATPARAARTSSSAGADDAAPRARQRAASVPRAPPQRGRRRGRRSAAIAGASATV